MTSTIEPGRDTLPGADDVVGSEVRPRSLLPTPREVELGAPSEDYVFEKPVETKVQRSVGERFRLTLQGLDPRTIEGPKRPLLIFGILAMFGAWDDFAIGVIYPAMRADFTFNIALLFASQQATGLLTQAGAPVIGYVSDRVKRVWMIRAGALIGNGASLLLGVAGSFQGLLASKALDVVGRSIDQPARQPLVADYYPPRSRVRATFFLATLAGAGSVIGPLIAGYMAARMDWRTVVIAFGGLTVVGSIGTFFLREPIRGYWERRDAGATDEEATETEPERPPSFVEGFRRLYGIRTLRKIWWSTMFTPALLYGNIYTYIYLAGQGFGPEQRSRVTAGAGFISFLTLFFGGAVAQRLTNRNPARVMLIFGGVYAMLAVAYIGIGLSPNPYLSVALLLPANACLGVVPALASSIASLIIPAHMRGAGINAGQWFQLGSLVTVMPVVFLLAPALGISPTGDQGVIFALALPTAVAAYLIGSSSLTVARDIRSAAANTSAAQEAEQAKLRGRNKMLICRDVDVTYDGVQVLFGVDFDVEEGELVALLGTNGAGKSTLMRAICGLQRASNGAIFLDGIDITQEPAHQNASRGIVMVPGGHAIFPTLTVIENLRTAAWLYQADDEYVAERTEEVLELFPVLRERLEMAAGNMSGGEQQMLAIGQALLMKPRLLMIDELSLGLAPAIVETLLATIRRIHAEGTTVVLIEQSINVAVTIAERAVFMEKGEIRFDGPTHELMRRPELIRAVFMGGAATGGPLSRTAAHRMRGEAREQLLAIEDVSVAFGGVRALDGATVHVAAEEIVGIIGPNGAGKTTLFDVISGFVKPDSGAVLLGGVDVTSMPPDARAKLGLGRSFQSARLFPSLTVRENIAVAMERLVKVKNPLLTASWSPKVRQNERHIGRRVDGLIDILGLGAYADKFVNELSTGTRRSVDIACIMASAPKMLLLDEPSSGLAQAETEALGPVLERVARDAGCGMLVIEHDIGLVSSISHRLYAMELGRVVTSGPPDEVVRDPRVVTSYLAATEDVVARSDLNRLMLEPDAVLGTTTEESRDGHVR